MASPTRIYGYSELLRACAFAGHDLSRETRAVFREVGEEVRIEAASRFERYSPKSAAGFRVRVRQHGVDVEQSLRRSTGTRPDFGALNMTRGLLPALEDREASIERRTEEAIDNVVDLFELHARWRGAGLLPA